MRDKALPISRRLLLVCLVSFQVHLSESNATPRHPSKFVLIPTFNNTDSYPRGFIYGALVGDEMLGAASPWANPGAPMDSYWYENSQTYKLYVRSDLAVDSIKVRKFSGNFVGASRDENYPDIDLESYYLDNEGSNDWYDHFPPNEYPAATNINTRLLEIPFVFARDFDLVPDRSQTLTFQSYNDYRSDYYHFDGATYYPLSGQTIAPDRFVIEGRCSGNTNCYMNWPYESMDSSNTATFWGYSSFVPVPSTEYNPKPGNERGPKKQIQCDPYVEAPGGDLQSLIEATQSSKLFSLSLNLATGNVNAALDDPVATRGYPLNNRIHINSQSEGSLRGMGESTFTYDIHLRAKSDYNHWTVFDGDGQILDFGNNAMPTPGSGIFSNLTVSSDGFQLVNAGAPENLKSAGNFTYSFDSNGVLLSIFDPAGNQQLLSYSDEKLTAVTDIASNKTITFEWNEVPAANSAIDRITAVVENNGPRTIISYSGRNAEHIAALSVQDAQQNVAESLAFTYNFRGIQSLERDGNPDTVHYFDYEDGFSSVSYAPLASVSVQNDPGGTWISPEYGLPTNWPGAAVRHTLINQNDGKITYDFDSNFDPVRVDEGAKTTLLSYQDRLITSLNDGAVAVNFEYEQNGKLRKVSRADGSFTQYNWNGADLDSISDSLGTIAQYTYGSSLQPHNPTAVTDGMGQTWTIQRNSYGQITRIGPPNGSPTGPTTFSYDESASSSSYGWLKKITNALGDETRMESYNEFGDVTTISTAPNRYNQEDRVTESRMFDSARRVKSLLHADGTSYNYNYTGRDLTSSFDENGKQKTFGYCPDCLTIESEAGPLGHSVRWERSQDHQLTQFIDSRSNETNYTYNQANQLTGTLNPDGTSFSYEYDNSGRLRSMTNGRHQITHYQYDTVGRLHQTSFSALFEPPEIINYRADDAVLSFTDSIGTTSYEYYGNRRVKAVIYDYSSSGLSNPQRVEYEYWPDNLLKKMTWKNGTSVVGTWNYNYDRAGRMSTVISFGNLTHYTYDGQGKILEQRNSNGSSTNYTWNNARGWPTSISHQVDYSTYIDDYLIHGVSPVGSYALTYDNGMHTVGNLTRMVERTGEVLNFGYDDLYRLTSESRTGPSPYTRTYSYDPAGNLKTLNGLPFGDYDAANKITAINGYSVSNDGDGNILQFTTQGTPATSMMWTTTNKLKQLSTNGAPLNFGYDARGHRVMQSDGTNSRFFIFDGDRLLGEIQNGTPKVAFTWGADGLIAERLLGSYFWNSDRTLWYHFGPQGETRYLTDSYGSVVDTYRYDAYGIPLSSTGTDYNPFRYGGKYGYHSNLNTAGLVLAGARWYSPDLRRWVSRDPIGYEGGENPYAYSKDSPTNFLDPKGEDPISPKVGSAGGPTAGARFGRTVKSQAFAENPARQCVFCGQEGNASHVDHAIPRALGGNATSENAQLACPHCNLSKGCGQIPKTAPPGYEGNWPPPSLNRFLGRVGILQLGLSALSGSLYDSYLATEQQLFCESHPGACI